MTLSRSPSSSSVIGAHSISRDWGSLSLAGFLGQRVVQALSHPRPVRTAWSLGWSLGDHLRSCPRGTTPLICRATSPLPFVAPARRAARPVRGALPRSCGGRPVTLAGVMEWCAGAAIITAREATSVDAFSRCVAGPTWEALSPVREPCSLYSHRVIREAGVVEPVRGAGLTGTPVVQSGNLGAYGPGRPVRL